MLAVASLSLLRQLLADGLRVGAFAWAIGTVSGWIDRVYNRLHEERATIVVCGFDLERVNC